MSRLTREELRRDEVREAVFTASTWFAEHVRHILAGVAAVIAAVIGVVLYVNHLDRREAEASFQLSEALEIYRAPVEEPETDAIDDLFAMPPDSAPPDDAAPDEVGSEGADATPEDAATEDEAASEENEAADEGDGATDDGEDAAGDDEDEDGLSFASEAERRAEARAALEAVVEEYGATASGRLASVYLGRIAAAEGDSAKARELWTAYLETNGGDHALAVGLQLNLYSLDRAEGRAEELAAELRGAVATEKTVLPKDALLFELGATLDHLGDAEGARETFQRIVDEYPESGYAVQARRQLGPEPSAGVPISFG